MSDPEIARRCPACGASIREIALFCPQCGDALPKRDEAEPSSLFAAELTTTKNTAPLEDADGPMPTSMSDTIAIERPESLSDTVAIERPQQPTPQPPTPQQPTPQQPRMSDTIAIARPKKSQPRVSQKSAAPPQADAPRVRAAVGTKLQRAGSIARGVEGDVKHRVQKVRKMSSVVIDEAGYDPSLRFVLVAAGLFVLFVIIMLLNRFIT